MTQASPTGEEKETVMSEYIVSNGRLLGFDVGDWVLLMSGCLVAALLTFPGVTTATDGPRLPKNPAARVRDARHHQASSQRPTS